MSDDQIIKAEEDSSFYSNRNLEETDFEILFRENYAPLCAFCEIKFRLSSEVAEDIVQAAFLKLWESRQNILSPGAKRSYLYKIVRNSTLDMLKHEKVKAKTEKVLLQNSLSTMLDEIYENIDFKKLDNDIELALSELPEQMKRVFILSKFDGLKYAEIALQLNISVKTVETQMSRALQRIRERLSGYNQCSLAALIWLEIFLRK